MSGPNSSPTIRSSAPPSSIPGAQSIPPGQLERRLRAWTLERLERFLLVVGLVYLPVALSHLWLMPPAGRMPMFALAIACALALYAAHRWLRRNRMRLGAANWLSSLLYACVVVHSLVRLLYAHEHGDKVFVGVLVMALALVPGRLPLHVGWMAGYIAGWSALLIRAEGYEAFRPYIASITLAFGLSVTIRVLEQLRTRRLEELRLLDVHWRA
jgi:hypothetical protein